MKTVFTFFMITFALSMILVTSGVLGEGNNWSSTQLIVDFLQGNDVSSTALWILVGAIIVALLAGVGANILTGGSSGAGITIAKATVFVPWIITIISDWRKLLEIVKVDATSTGLDTVVYYIVFILGGLVIIGFAYSIIEYLFEND